MRASRNRSTIPAPPHPPKSRVAWPPSGSAVRRDRPSYWQLALQQSLGIELEALVQPENQSRTDVDVPALRDTFRGHAGQTFDVALTFHARSGDAPVKMERLGCPAGRLESD